MCQLTVSKPFQVYYKQKLFLRMQTQLIPVDTRFSSFGHAYRLVCLNLAWDNPISNQFNRTCPRPQWKLLKNTFCHIIFEKYEENVLLSS